MIGYKGITIGFAGVDKQDIILYLARILYHIGKQVLIVDKSESQAVTECIPCPAGLENTMIEYRGIYFVNGRKSEKDLPAILRKKNFDYILTDYGFWQDEKEFTELDYLIYVTDQQKHNMNRIMPMIKNRRDRQSIVIRDVVGHISDMRDRISFQELSMIPADRVFIIYQDELDTKFKLRCQYEIVFRFGKLSVPAQNAIKGLIMEIVSGLDKKDFFSAYRKAKRGE